MMGLVMQNHLVEGHLVEQHIAIWKYYLYTLCLARLIFDTLGCLDVNLR